MINKNCYKHFSFNLLFDNIPRFSFKKLFMFGVNDVCIKCYRYGKSYIRLFDMANEKNVFDVEIIYHD